MLISEKINFKIYLLLSLILLVPTYFIALDFNEYKVFLIIFIAVCFNQLMLVRAVELLTQQAISTGESNSGTIMALVIGKVILLVVALIFGVQIMGKRIIIPVLIYVLQIGVLTLSLTRPSKEQGSK